MKTKDLHLDDKTGKSSSYRPLLLRLLARSRLPSRPQGTGTSSHDGNDRDSLVMAGEQASKSPSNKEQKRKGDVKGRRRVLPLFCPPVGLHQSLVILPLSPLHSLMLLPVSTTFFACPLMPYSTMRPPYPYMATPGTGFRDTTPALPLPLSGVERAGEAGRPPLGVRGRGYMLGWEAEAGRGCCCC